MDIAVIMLNHTLIIPIPRIGNRFLYYFLYSSNNGAVMREIETVSRQFGAGTQILIL